MRKLPLLLTALLALPATSFGAEQIVVMRAISAQGQGAIIGTVRLSDSDKGLVLDPDIGNLTPGTHGFHVHEKPSCDAGVKDGKPGAGLAAGGHYDPHGSGKHAGPQGEGHQGDLPALEVSESGEAVRTLVAPRLKLADIKGRALMIHAGGDNYSDAPQPLGGGGARVACGVIE